jgi:hypothetical protein
VGTLVIQYAPGLGSTIPPDHQIPLQQGEGRGFVTVKICDIRNGIPHLLPVKALWVIASGWQCVVLLGWGGMVLSGELWSDRQFVFELHRGGQRGRSSLMYLHNKGDMGKMPCTVDKLQKTRSLDPNEQMN